MSVLPSISPARILSLFCCLMALFLWACPRGEVENQLKLSPFFDLQDFVDQEVTRLKTSGIRAEKTIELNGKSETQNLDAVDFDQELVLLRNADINRPAWLDQYKVDSLMEGGKLRQLSYQALSEELRTQRLIINYDDGKADC